MRPPHATENARKWRIVREEARHRDITENQSHSCIGSYRASWLLRPAGGVARWPYGLLACGGMKIFAVQSACVRGGGVMTA